MPATPLPNDVTRTNTDAATDDVAQARAELDTGLSAINTIKAYLAWLFGSDGEKATAIQTLGISTSPTISAQTASFTAGTTDNTLYVVTPSGASAICTLPALSSVADGFRVSIKNNTDGKDVTFARAGADTIDGATTYRIPGRGIVELTRVSASTWAVTRAPSHMVGETIEWSSNTLPAGGWAWRNGQALSRTTYSGLFAHWGTDFGTGDGSTTFNVPNDCGYAKVGREAMGGVAAVNRVQTSTTINTTNASTSATVASATGLNIGMKIISANVPNGTTISSISGTTIVMSAAATATASGVAARFSNFDDAEGLNSTAGEQNHVQTASEMTLHAHGNGSLAVSGSGGHGHDTKVQPSDIGGSGPRTFSNSAINTEGAGTLETIPNNTDAISGGDHSHALSGAMSNAGGSVPMSLMQPSATTNFIVKT